MVLLRADTASYKDPGVMLDLGPLGLPGRVRRKKNLPATQETQV